MNGLNQNTPEIDWNPWCEYDAAADWCAARNLKGKIGDPLPNLMSKAAVDLISSDPEAFEIRVRQCAYARAMERVL